jgi:hypothetical protein
VHIFVEALIHPIYLTVAVPPPQTANHGQGIDEQAPSFIDIEMNEETPYSYYEEPEVPNGEWNDAPIRIITDSIRAGPPKPNSYIRMMYHERTGLPEKIVDLDAPNVVQAPLSAPSIPGFSPFPTMKDFTYAEEMITTCAPARSINHHLRHGYPDNKLRSAKQIYECVDGIASVYPQVSTPNLFLYTYSFQHLFPVIVRA